MQDFVYIRFTKKQSMIARKSEHTTYIGVLLFSASPKFGCIPSGGGWSGVLDNCSGVSFKREDMIDLCFDSHTTQSIDAGRKESQVRLLFYLRSRHTLNQRPSILHFVEFSMPTTFQP